MASSDPTRQPERILLIDDDAISREVLSILLEMEGFPVDSAVDGAQALDLLQKAPKPPEATRAVNLGLLPSAVARSATKFGRRQTAFC
jgi:CheY-like chemotaxis protein